MAMGLDMSVTLIGNVGFLQAAGSDVNINMTFWLLEDVDDLEDSKVFRVVFFFNFLW